MCPELIVEGYVYAAVPPLFRITTKKNEYIYLKDLKELNEYKEKNGETGYTVNRNKGLGEQDSDELEECLLNPKTRNVMQICVEDVEATSALFETLMGKQVAPRKEFLLKHAEEANV